LIEILKNEIDNELLVYAFSFLNSPYSLCDLVALWV